MMTVLRTVDFFLPDNSSVSFQTAPQHFISDGSTTFHFRRLRNNSFQTALQHFISYGIRTEMVVTYMDTL